MLKEHLEYYMLDGLLFRDLDRMSTNMLKRNLMMRICVHNDSRGPEQDNMSWSQTLHTRTTKIGRLYDYMICHNRVRSPHVHQSLRHDLINHLWRSFGDGE
ncbi:unnamed protein product [Prunus armeniaca]